MNFDELEEMLAEVLPSGFQIDTDESGQIIVFTGLAFDEDGEVVDFEGEDEDEDLEADPDFEPLEDDDDNDE